MDKLALVGHFIIDADHIEAIFNGLLEEYDTFVILVNSRPESYTVAEIESLLLAQKVRIEKHLRENDTALINLATQEIS